MKNHFHLCISHNRLKTMLFLSTLLYHTRTLIPEEKRQFYDYHANLFVYDERNETYYVSPQREKAYSTKCTYNTNVKGKHKRFYVKSAAISTFSVSAVSITFFYYSCI